MAVSPIKRILKGQVLINSAVLVFIALTVLIIYSNIYQSPFIFDDRPGIQENLDIRNVGNYLSFDRLLKPRDIVNLTFALNYRLGKLNVFGYHLVNVLIHIINGFLVYFLAHTIFKQLYLPNIREDDSSARQGLQIQAERRKAKGERRKGKSIRQEFTIFNFQFSIPMMSLVVALIFVAHPIQTQAVTYTAQRYASIAAMFYLAAVFFYLKARIIQQGAVGGGQRTEVRRQREGHGGQRSEGSGHGSEGRGTFDFRLSTYFGLSIVCGMLAFLSKQNTASLPGVILLAEYLLIDRRWEGWKRKIPWFVAMFTLWTVFVLYVAGFFSGGIEGRGLLEDVSDFMQETENVSRWSYLCTQFNVLVIYIRLLFLPIGQNLDYVYPFSPGFFYGYTVLAFLFLTAIVGIGVWNVKKRPVIAFGIFWFFITLSVESSIIPIRDALFEHRLYLPMFGFALTISYMVFHFLKERLSWAIIVSAVIIMSLGTATYLRNMKWKDEITLWTDVSSKNLQNTRAKNNLGNSLVLQRRYKEATIHYYDVLRIEPDNVDAHLNLGNALALMRDFNSAISHYVRAIQIDPGNEKVYFNLGNALMDQGKDKKASSQYLNALRIRPDFAEAHCKLGNVLMKQGDQNRAVVHFLEALRLKPDYLEVYNNLGIALASQGKLDQAIIIFKKALRINPNDIWVQRNLDQALREKARSGIVRPK